MSVDYSYLEDKYEKTHENNIPYYVLVFKKNGTGKENAPLTLYPTYEKAWNSYIQLKKKWADRGYTLARIELHYQCGLSF